MHDLLALQRRCAPAGVHASFGNEGLARLTIANVHAEAELYLHGAHLTHWRPAGHEPALWMSSRSAFTDGKPIRGGVPICFPWFGPHPDAKPGDALLPPHGFARLREWTLDAVEQLPDGRTRLALALASDAATEAAWPHAFRIVSTVTVGAELEMELAVTNRSPAEFTFAEALHTYLAVADVRACRIAGLKGATYIDKTKALARVVEDSDALALVGETDRVYLTEAALCETTDPGNRRRIAVSKSGSKATVVWNPWTERAKAFTDFTADLWPSMLCIETVNAADAVARVASGATHRMSARIAVRRA